MPTSRLEPRVFVSARIVIVAAVSGLLLAGAAFWATSRAHGPPQAREWVQDHGFRWAELPVRRSGSPGFEALDPGSLGIDFRNSLSEEQIVENRNLLNGSGVALGDVTGNGFVDVYLARLDGPNRLYENLGGWRFADITDEAGVALPNQFSTGATFADLNGNGHLDLVVTANGAPNRIFLNDGAGRFTELEGALATDREHGSTSVALADVTGNGALDVYIANYKARSVRDIWPNEQEFRFVVQRVEGEHRIQDRYREHYRLEMRDSGLVWFEEGEPDLLFLNDGRAGFTPVPLDSGVLHDEDGRPILEPLRDWGLHARFQDISGDGFPDLYVANDFESPDRVWLNRGDGTFRALPRLAVRKSSLSSMAVDFADVNRDGHLDFFVVEMASRTHEKRLRQMGTMAPSPRPIGAIDDRPKYMGNTLFVNRGDDTWAELSEYAGVRRSDWSWSTFFLDLDLDGYEDILVSTGHHYDVQDADVNQLIRNRLAMGRLDLERVMLMYPPLEERNAIFRNRGDGTFEEVTEAWGFLEPDVSHGMALADLDGSGYPDLVVNRLGYPVAVYRNTSRAPRVQVRLRGEAPNTQGTGAKIHFRGGPVPQWKEVVAGGTYLSGSDPTYVFATGGAEGPFTIDVEWRSGRRSTVAGVRPNRSYEIEERGVGAPVAAGAAPSDGAATAQADLRDPPDGADPFFEDVSHRLDHTHHENDHADFARQPLLPYRLSRLGPGIAWFDATGDGLDDLFVSSGAGGAPAWFRNRGGGTFERATGSALTRAAPSDGTAVVGWWEDGVPRLLVGASSFETGDPDADGALRFRLGGGGTSTLVGGISGAESSTGALALGDYTGDGRLDLFVGGRVVPRRYPTPASSRLFRNDGAGGFVLDEENTRRLEGIGLVTGALFTDLTGDGVPELLLARAWRSLAVLTMRDGHFEDVTEEWGLAGMPGWWTGVATGDLNGNGRLDIVAANWGTNHPYAATSRPEHPVRIRYGDLNGSGAFEVIETYYAPGLQAEVPRRSLSVIGSELPFVQDRVRTYEEFARSSIEEVIGGRLLETSAVEASHFRHTIFWNREEGFIPEPLPEKAQWAPAFHVAVADLSGDGAEDVFLSQNFFSYQLETPRSDAGRALWLRGDGAGGFEPVPGHESGILVWGEQRGAALGDFDGDGRVDVAVTQNGAATRLFRNRGAVPGLRVRLRGTDANPGGVGSWLRLVYEGGEGPVREVQAGSGYWSQNSLTQVLGIAREPLALRVRWPGGEVVEYPLPPGVREVEANLDGSLRVASAAGGST